MAGLNGGNGGWVLDGAWAPAIAGQRKGPPGGFGAFRAADWDRLQRMKGTTRCRQGSACAVLFTNLDCDPLCEVFSEMPLRQVGTYGWWWWWCAHSRLRVC
jgi:hypothetical protein